MPTSTPGRLASLASCALALALAACSGDTALVLTLHTDSDAVATATRLALYVGGASVPVWEKQVGVPSGTLVVEGIPVTTTTASSTLVVTPLGGGAVYAGREVTEKGSRGPMLALAPILPQRTTALVPTVVSQPGSSVPGVSSR